MLVTVNEVQKCLETDVYMKVIQFQLFYFNWTHKLKKIHLLFF